MVPDPASRAQAADVHDASIVVADDFAWRHPDWKGLPWNETMIYEVHAGSWMRACHTWDDLADRLVPYAVDMGFSHLELMPITEHPFGGSWGYQPLSLFAPTAPPVSWIEHKAQAGPALVCLRRPLFPLPGLVAKR